MALENDAHVVAQDVEGMNAVAKTQQKDRTGSDEQGIVESNSHDEQHIVELGSHDEKRIVARGTQAWYAIVAKMPPWLQRIFTNYDYRSYFLAGSASAITAAYLLYNLYLGLRYGILWSLSISAYYALLVGMRVVIIALERRWKDESDEVSNPKRARVFKYLTRLLLLLDFVLIAPAVLMVLEQREISEAFLSSIPVITLATYTVYKVILAIVNYFNARKREDLLVFGIRIINVEDAIVSLMTLQYIMILTFGNPSEMTTFSAWTTGILLAIMIVFTIQMIRQGNRK